MRPWRSARASASSLFPRSTTLKNRPRAPLRMQARAMATARCDLPVPVPTDQHDIALLLEGASAREAPDQRLVDRADHRA